MSPRNEAIPVKIVSIKIQVVLFLNFVDEKLGLRLPPWSFSSSTAILLRIKLKSLRDTPKLFSQSYFKALSHSFSIPKVQYKVRESEEAYL